MLVYHVKARDAGDVHLLLIHVMKIHADKALFITAKTTNATPVQPHAKLAKSKTYLNVRVVIQDTSSHLTRVKSTDARNACNCVQNVQVRQSVQSVSQGMFHHQMDQNAIQNAAVIVSHVKMTVPINV